MPYQFVREPLIPEDADKLANACETLQEKLIIWTLLDTGLRVSELCNLTLENIQWQTASSASRVRVGIVRLISPCSWCFTGKQDSRFYRNYKGKTRENWLRGLDLNQGPSGYEPDELPGCSTPRSEGTECVSKSPGSWQVFFGANSQQGGASWV